MIVPENRKYWHLVQYVGWPLVALAAWDLVIVFAFKVLHWEWVGSPHVPLGLYGSAIGVIVGFRNNSAYGRWWEGRQLWGQIVNNSRSLARQVTATLRPVNGSSAEEREDLRRMQVSLVHHQVAYVQTLRQQLRGLNPLPEAERLLGHDEAQSLESSRNVALTLQQRMGRMLRTCEDRGWIDSIGWQAMDRNLDDLADAQGGAERIKNTPMPKQYDYFPQLFVQLYCVVLPMGMVTNLGWYTPLGSTLVGFMFLALDKIGRDLEDPFDNTIFDVPLTAICRTIEINLRQLLGEESLPAAETPQHGVLW